MKPARNLSTTVSILLIFLTCLYALTGIMPRAIVSDSVPETEFSVSRALDHLKVIAEKPHYVGAEYHKVVREYLVSELEKLGLEVEIQEEEVLGKKFRTGTHVKNIVARVRGRDTGKALLLLSHYDSEVHSSFGASDAGSGVVTILEGLRAYLAQGEQPRNDIIVLISDAEELGLLGAEAFVDKHRWFKDLGLVLNFEARGSGGPAFMFVETNRGNEKLIQAFDAAKTTFPVSNSLLYSIYKLMPNDTDLTAFRKFGNIQGYNFAFIDDHFDYHTSQDNFERLDRNSLQHQASYLMPSLTYFSQADLGTLSSDRDLVFFNFPGLGLIYYPFGWVLPTALTSLFILLIIIALGIKKKKLSIPEISLGFVPLLIVLPVIGLVSFYVWELLLKIHPDYREMLQGFTYNGHLYITAFVSLALWLTLRVYQNYLKKRNAYNLFIAPLLIWLLINLGAAVYLPGAGFFIIPVVTGVLILAIFLFYHKKSPNRVILSTVITLPMLLIFVPLTGMFPVGLGLRMILISTLLSSLILMVFLPILSTYAGLKNLNKLFLITALLTFASASYNSGFSAESKRPDSILYLRNESSSVSYWASNDYKTDEFTRQFLGENPSPRGIDDPALQNAGIRGFSFHKEAPTITLASTDVTTVNDSTFSGLRFITLRIEPKRPINRMDFRLHQATRVVSLKVEGEPAITSKGADYLLDGKASRMLFSYHFSDSKKALQFSYSVPENDDPSLFVIEASYDLLHHPEIKRLLPNLMPRENHLMEKPFIMNNSIINLKEINF